jgi:hypothetical protein
VVITVHLFAHRLHAVSMERQRVELLAGGQPLGADVSGSTTELLYGSQYFQISFP